MSILDTLYSPKGRLPRLRYFGYSMLNVLIMMVGVALPVAVAMNTLGPNPLLMALLVLIAVVVGLASVYSGYALMIKRLHDFGWSGLNVIWIMLLGAAAGAMEVPGSSLYGLGVLLNLVSIGTSLYVLFCPGEKVPNQYGEVPQ